MYDVPKPEVLREFLRIHDLTGAAAARLVGVDSRTVRKWTAAEGADNRRAIPWSAWSLLRILSGEATPAAIRREAESA
jgi:hypothetical protein